MKKNNQTISVRKTAECVSPAHPDKLCDQISDAVLDACLRQDPASRVACETMGSHGKIWITGEITTSAIVDYEQCACEMLIANRYDPEEYEIIVHISQQSPDIARGVDTGGAGDQGIMIGYATRETKEMIPLELQLSRSILQDLRDISPLTRDAKAQVTTLDGEIHSIVVSAERVSDDMIEEYLVGRFGADVTLHINAAGPWSDGGFAADVGLTGRKLAVDNYGPQIPIGGGAFSGKDRSKVDRSATYIARYIACDHLRGHDDVERAKVSVAYCIGVAEPVMVSIETDQGVVEYDGNLDLTPDGIRQKLNLTQPQFGRTAKWGHFGHGFVWERHSYDGYFAQMTDGELISSFNNQVGDQGFGREKGRYLGSLRVEIQNRDFDSSILFDGDILHFSRKVYLVDGGLIFVDEQVYIGQIRTVLLYGGMDFMCYFCLMKKIVGFSLCALLVLALLYVYYVCYGLPRDNTASYEFCGSL